MMFAAFLAAMAVCLLGVMMSYRLESHVPPARHSALGGPRVAR